MVSCLPDRLPLGGECLDTRVLLPRVASASRALARYDGALLTLPNPGLLLSPLTANEAVLSSRIEGTQATLDEVLEHEAGAEPSPDRRDDIEEVSNYRAAVRYADRAVEERGLTLGLIRELHQNLMQGVRGSEKRPGAFRTDQNWIGRPGSPIEAARFVPPDPVVMLDALRNWQAYVADPADDPIIAVAVAHAQFEIIHPFNDGNGRIGRMIIPLLLARQGVISRPSFYISQYLEEHRDEYYDRLLAVTEQRDWTGWVDFFCEAIAAQAGENLARAQSLHRLYTEMRQRFVDVTHSQHASSALEVFFQRPIVETPDFATMGGFNNRMTAANILRQLEEAELITCVRRGAGRRPSRYAMLSVIRTAEGLQ